MTGFLGTGSQTKAENTAHKHFTLPDNEAVHLYTFTIFKNLMWKEIPVRYLLLSGTRRCLVIHHHIHKRRRQKMCRGPSHSGPSQGGRTWWRQLEDGHWSSYLIKEKFDGKWMMMLILHSQQPTQSHTICSLETNKPTCWHSTNDGLRKGLDTW